jgi:hypothetical protein
MVATEVPFCVPEMVPLSKCALLKNNKMLDLKRHVVDPAFTHLPLHLLLCKGWKTFTVLFPWKAITWRYAQELSWYGPNVQLQPHSHSASRIREWDNGGALKSYCVSSKWAQPPCHLDTQRVQCAGGYWRSALGAKPWGKKGLEVGVSRGGDASWHLQSFYREALERGWSISMV